MGEVRRLLAVSGLTVLLAGSAIAASIVPPRDLGELAVTSQAIVLGQAVRSRVLRRGPLLFTETTFLVEQTVKGAGVPSAGGKGPVRRPAIVTVLAPGGELDGEGWLVAGSPRFEAGETYLLMLDRKDAEHWQPRLLSYGLLRRIVGRDGSELLAPLDEAKELEAFPRPDGVAPEPPGTYRKRELLERLGAVAAGQASWSAAQVAASPEQVPLAVAAMAPPSSCRFMTSTTTGNRIRWTVFDSNPPGLLTMYADSDGDTSLSGGGYSQVQGGLGIWNGTNTSLNLAYGGTMAFTLACDSVGQEPDTPPSGTNIVVFNDPCGDIADPACPGILAFGGPWFESWSTHTFDGSPWHAAISWFVVVNNGAGCLGSTNYELMMAHELGHGLGFGHHQDSGALMWGSCCHNLNATDNACAEYTYPSLEPGPPSPPSGVAASDGTYADRVRVSWNSSSGATSYKVFRNTVNDSGGAGQIGTPGSSPFDDFTATPGATYWYWVKATNTYGDSGFSGSNSGFAATIPDAPTGVQATDGTYVDRVRVSWNASSGATSYKVYRHTSDSSGSATLIWTQAGSQFDDYSAAAGPTYWYWVKASNVAGDSAFSASDSGFRAACSAPGSFTMTSPANGATVGASPVALVWAASANATSYDVYFGTNPSPPFLQNTAGTSVNVTVAAGNTYYWRVVAKNACGTTSASSGTWSFSFPTCTLPGAFAMTSPANGATVGASPVALVWAASANATSYDVYFGTNPSPPFLQNTAGTSVNVTVAAGNTYYWRVVAKNACGTTPSSSGTRSFTFPACTAPAAFALSSPADGATVTASPVTLTWMASANATSYDVYFGAGATPPLVANVTGTSYPVAVTNGASYSWKVVAKNACGQMTSAQRSFAACTTAAPGAEFTWSPQGTAPGFPEQQQPYVGQVVAFLDQSTNSPTAWSWYDFQGSGVYYTAQNPTHTWSSSGPKNVRLVASNCAGSSAEKLKTVTVYADVRHVTADFTWSPSPAVSGTVITFTAAQGYAYGDPTHFDWTFKDDNATASGAVVGHTFACGDSFDVVLTARRGAYQQTVTKTVAVGGESCCDAPGVPVADFTWSPQGTLPEYPEQLQPFVGQVVALTDQSSNQPASWSWGGLPAGSAATAQHPTAVWTTPGSKSVTLVASNCAGSSTMKTRSIQVYPDVRPVLKRFDFGTATSPLASGFTRVANTSAYSAASGFGWLSGVIGGRDRGTADALLRDLNFTALGTFVVDVPNGIYDVTLTAGDATAGHDQVGIFLEGAQVDSITTATGKWVSRVYHLAVADGQLTLTIADQGGNDANGVIDALVVASAPVKRFDFGIGGSPVAASFIGVPNTLRYSTTRGYGWLTGTVGGRDRGSGGALSRDINFSTLATFAVDVRNGEYDVTVRVGDMGAGHDQVGVFLEGVYADLVTTAAGEVAVRTYRTVVADGQLSLTVDDLGGVDANGALTGFEVAEVGPPELTLTLPGNVPLVLKRVPAGTFAMGSPDSERGRSSEEGPQHEVMLTTAYWIGRDEVTQAHWQAIMGSNPAAGAGVAPDMPVYNVTWNDVAGPGGFLEKLNQHLAATAQVGAGLLRLPSEAEWERAARAGTASRFAFGDALACNDVCGPCPEAEANMWYCGNAGSTNHEAGLLSANAFGLADTHGNVWEWVADRWGPYPAARQTDPTGPATGAYRVVRGGDSFGSAADARAARRDYQSPGSSAGNIGLRVARTE